MPTLFGNLTTVRPTCRSITEHLIVGSGLVSALHGTETSTKKDTKRNSGGNSTDEDPDEPASGGLRVILVRDEQTQSALQKKVPTSTLVLTIAQSKGMEFDDVFLYNFFTTSPYRSDFKILEDLLCERYSLETGESARYANWDMIDSVSDKHIFSPRPSVNVLINEIFRSCVLN